MGDAGDPASPPPRRSFPGVRRRWREVLAWVGVAAVMASPVPGPPESTVDVMVTAARLDALTRSLTGSIEELRAAELVSYHRGESAVVACMRR
jgi:hypothetical protein